MRRWIGRRRAVALAAVALSACSAEKPVAEPAADTASTQEARPAPPETAPGAAEEPGTSGLFRKLRPERVDPSLSSEQREMIARLEAIGYATGTTAAGEQSGITVHDPERAYRGYNLYTSGHAPEAILTDMSGNVLHRWRYELLDVWPDFPREWLHVGAGYWRRAYLFDNGDLIAIYEGSGIIKVDKDSKLLWSNPVMAHHDLEVMPDGDIYVLTRKAGVVPSVHPTKPILEDFITLLDADGKEKRRWSLIEALQNSDFADRVELNPDEFAGDVFHTNTLEVLDGRIADRDPAFRAGNILISILKLDLIAVVDLEQEKFVWMQQGSFKSQHDPKVLANGNLLLFDNRGANNHSRVLEFDPATPEQYAWEFRGTQDDPFYTWNCGAAERLPNGNTLVTESDGGRAFEVTPDKEIVWEFVNPHRAGDENELIATLFEVLRLPPDFPLDWAQGRLAHSSR